MTTATNTTAATAVADHVRDLAAILARIGITIDPAAAATVHDTAGGPSITAMTIADVYAFDAADGELRRALTDLDRSAADARVAVADGNRIDPGHVVGAAHRVEVAANARQRAADGVVRWARIIRDMVAA